jgi:hypothetical protein
MRSHRDMLFFASGKVEMDVSFVLAAMPPKRTKQNASSLLPEPVLSGVDGAKNARCGTSNHATA